ncbi:MAG: hypothetical protein E7413_04795 [Ruminococcaceae bacterium]|nr:hypothetical protein [Oscillospiraceae bacterium]
MKRFAALLLAVLMMFVLAACNNQDGSDGVKDSTEVKSIAGVYQMTSFEENGEEEEIADIKLMFYPDGTISGSEIGMQDFSWTQDGDVISIKQGENALGCSVDGDTLTLTYEDEHESSKMVLTRISDVEMDPVAGTYQITHYEKDQEESTEEFSDMELIVYANGTCKYQGADVIKHFRWNREGDQLTFAYGGDVTEVKTFDMTVDGDDIIYDRYGEKAIFSKQK